jgi:hypothetical protein
VNALRSPRNHVKLNKMERTDCRTLLRLAAAWLVRSKIVCPFSPVTMW